VTHVTITIVKNLFPPQQSSFQSINPLAISSEWFYNLTGKNILFRRYAMADVATTKMSSKGQVVIPETIRKRLNLRAGSQFVVVGENDVVILKNISPPAMGDFDRLIADTRKKVKQAGIKPADITAAIARARGRK
jgi:AbrB family looped-hinge helix DNA binding protein